jgi:hypothetical protein
MLKDKACEDLDNDEGKDSENYEELFSEIEEDRRREEAVYEKERVCIYFQEGM